MSQVESYSEMRPDQLGASMRRGTKLTIAVTTITTCIMGCSSTKTHPHGRIVCGVRIPTGAMMPALIQLKAPSSRQYSMSLPTHSQIPASVTAGPSFSAGSFIQVSNDCSHGAVVIVRPQDAARTIQIIDARDRRIALIGLLVDRPLTVFAWREGRPIGQVTVRPS